MSGHKAEQPPISCADCCAKMQEYLDGSMPKTDSLRIFLHLRGCDACAAESDQWQALFQRLGTLPVMEPPVDFDHRILESVPYASYRAMAELRKPRVPVLLAAETLPAAIRAPRVRLTGLAIALTAGVAMVWGSGSSLLDIVVLVGALPEILVRFQGLGRVTFMALRRSAG